MKRVIRVVDEARGIVQISLPDERWYTREVRAPLSKNPARFSIDLGNGDVSECVPSVTWITSHYPMGKAFFEWLKKVGAEADNIKRAAGDKGSRIHYACAALLSGDVITWDSKFYSELTDSHEYLTPEEFAAVMSFKDWYDNGKCPRCRKAKCVKVVAFEYVVWNDKLGYAGSVDLKCQRSCDLAYGIVDIKSSKAVHEGHRAQISAYRRSDPDTAGRKGWQAILQVGYTANKTQHYKLTMVPNSDWKLFVTARRIWLEQSAGITPHQKDYPLSIAILERVEKARSEAAA